ncbi:MAG TPA: glycine zipper 2TM domain-containing protein [Caulobacteraceae bacterium]|jgi:outer membrane lipoprotein SlyB
MSRSNFIAPMRKGAVALSLAAMTSVGLTACASDPGPQSYNRYEVGAPARVEQAEVIGYRPVNIGGGETSGGGAVAGAVGGGLVGNAVSRGGGRAGGTVIGAIGGALLGNAIEKSANNHQGFAYTVRMRRDGRQFEVVQADASPIPVGAPVNVSFGDRVRIYPVGGYGPPPQ